MHMHSAPFVQRTVQTRSVRACIPTEDRGNGHRLSFSSSPSFVLINAFPRRASMPTRRSRKPLWSALLLLIGLLTAACSNAGSATSAAEGVAPETVVARIAGEALTLAAFEARYVRSSAGGDRAAAAADSLVAYRDFLERYVDYRLKVRAAEAAGLETDSMRQEVRRYRAQTARPALLDQEVMQPIIRTLYERQQTQVAPRHLLIAVPEGAAPADTLAAYQEALALRDSLRRGADFGELALRYSDDPSAAQEGQRGYRGFLGYVQGGQVVEAFEDAAYAAPVDSVAGPVRTPFGVHLIRVEDRRPAAPPSRFSHILLRPGGAARADTAAARALADSLARRLALGDDFAALARQYSDDAPTAAEGGDLGTLSRTGALVPAFEEAAFALDSVGAVSDPVQTRFGVHLIKLTEREALPTYDEAYDDLKALASRLPRTQQAEQALARRLRAQHGARLDTAALGRADLFAEQPASARPSDEVVAALGDSSYTLGALRAYARQRRQERSAEAAPETPLALADAFLSNAALAYEAQALEERDPDFRARITEFRDGLLLFQLMQDSVWTAATQDTAALRRRYAADPERFGPDQSFEDVRAALVREEQDAREAALLAALRRRYEVTTYPERLSQAFSGPAPSGAATAGERPPR